MPIQRCLYSQRIHLDPHVRGHFRVSHRRGKRLAQILAKRAYNLQARVRFGLKRRSSAALQLERALRRNRAWFTRTSLPPPFLPAGKVNSRARASARRLEAGAATLFRSMIMSSSQGRRRVYCGPSAICRSTSNLGSNSSFREVIIAGTGISSANCSCRASKYPLTFPYILVSRDRPIRSASAPR